MRPAKNPLIFILVLQASLLCAPAYSFCGFYAGKADATLLNTASQVMVVRDGHHTVLSMLNNYSGPLSEFALIVPTPVVLRPGQVRVADRAVFEHVNSYSSPRLVDYYDSDPCRANFTWGQIQNLYRKESVMSSPLEEVVATGRRRDRALGVRVDARYTLEEYDIVSLSAQRSDGLEIWLRENGYRIPQGASAALKPYINQGMKFFIAKVNLKRQARSGYTLLRPLQFAYDSEKFMLPMRLGMLNAPPDQAQDLIVYFLTRQGRVESSNYRTTPLPTGVNVPAFIKPKFQDFYQAMFETASRREDYRVVFTEYFWDMAWCDPCAAEPLSREELQKAGVFWLDSAGMDVKLTRLHVRYTPRTFPEDLMFIQTADQGNWQARYIVQNPYGGSVAECSERVGKMDCASMCTRRVSDVLTALGPQDTIEKPQQTGKDDLPSITVQGTALYSRGLEAYRGRSPEALSDECIAACRSSKASGLDAAIRYYDKDLPERIAAEKQTLAQLTGWSLHDIDAIPEAQRFSTASPESYSTRNSASASARQPWWHKLFSN